MLVIGIAGPVCAGKSTLARFIEKNVADSAAIGLSEYVKREVRLPWWRREPNRKDYANAAGRLTASGGPRAMVEMFLEDERLNGVQVAIADGIRLVEQHRYLAEHCDEYVLLWMDAARDVRWRRSHYRGRFDEKNLSFIQFATRELTEGIEVLSWELRDHADLVFRNEGGYPELYESASRIVRDARWMTQT